MLLPPVPLKSRPKGQLRHPEVEDLPEFLLVTTVLACRCPAAAPSRVRAAAVTVAECCFRLFLQNSQTKGQLWPPEAEYLLRFLLFTTVLPRRCPAASPSQVCAAATTIADCLCRLFHHHSQPKGQIWPPEAEALTKFLLVTAVLTHHRPAHPPSQAIPRWPTIALPLPT